MLSGINKYGMSGPGRSTLVLAFLLGCLEATGCARGPSRKPAAPAPESQPAPGLDVHASGEAADPIEIPPEELEFPEPPGSDAGQAEVPLQGTEIPDLSDQIQILPAALDPTHREGLAALADRNDVVNAFDMPTSMESERFIYLNHQSFPDFQQIVFRFDIQGSLIRVDLFPSGSITRQDVIGRYGGGFSRKTTGNYEILKYRGGGPIFFILVASDKVHSIRLKK